jgi:hypothetical protein
MSAPRLMIKQSTGWFAAGWAFGNAMTALSDAAFKVFAWLCLNADRRNGRVRVIGGGLEIVAISASRVTNRKTTLGGVPVESSSRIRGFGVHLASKSHRANPFVFSHSCL